jgi:two-component system sensor histidine kinase VanS
VSIRLRLALSYASFLMAAGIVVVVAVYIVLRFVPNYPLTPADPRDLGDAQAFFYRARSRQDILEALMGVSGFIFAGLGIIGVTGGWILAGVILRPLHRINRAARIAATGRLDHRIHLAGPRDEFRELADSFDYMLERLHDAFETQERFAANASHELRTPLTITATMLEVAQADPEGQDYPVLLERLRLTNARAIAITEALLRLSNANAITLNSEPLDLAEIASEIAAECADEAEEKQVELEVDVAPALISGDRTLMEQLATNLIQNAIRHNHANGHVLVSTGYEPGTLKAVLWIENTGAFYTKELAARLTEPFLRGDARIRGATSGHGLGLTLVDRITSLHEGKLSIAPREEGGLITAVTLPSRASATTRSRNGPRQAPAVRGEAVEPGRPIANP